MGCRRGVAQQTVGRDSLELSDNAEPSLHSAPQCSATILSLRLDRFSQSIMEKINRCKAIYATQH
jgi:hypothetical protein